MKVQVIIYFQCKNRANKITYYYYGVSDISNIELIRKSLITYEETMEGCVILAIEIVRESEDTE